MTVAELISELMKYGPLAEVKINIGVLKGISNVMDVNKGDLVLIEADDE